MPRPSLALALAVALALVAGCAAKADDPFAYTKKPLYAGGFLLEELQGQTQTHEFRMTDGSVTQLHVQVWVNATAGGGTVEIVDPSGQVVLLTQESTSMRAPLDMGAWKVKVTGDPGSAGTVHVLVTRS